MSKSKSSVDRLFARYRKNTTGVRGDSATWSAIGDVLAKRAGNYQESLAIFGLQQLPTEQELNRAWKKLMMKAHPDRGGTHDEARAINEAYTKLLKFYATEPVAVATSTSAQATGLVLPPRCTADLPASFTSSIGDLKVDGDRVMVYLNVNPYGGQGTTLLTRHIGKSGKYGTRIHKLQPLYDGLDDTVIDAELYQGILYAFDCPRVQGRNIESLTLTERREILKSLLAKIDHPTLQLIPSWDGSEEDLWARFQEVVRSGLGGGEGLVIKNPKSAYGQEWSKLKKSYDVSAFITGFTSLGALVLSVFDGKEVIEVGSPTNFIQVGADRDQFLNRVVDVYAQELTTHGKLRHATYLRFRDDLNTSDCTMDKLKDDFKKAALAKRER